MPSKRQQGSEDEGSSFEDIFDDIEDEDTIFDPSLLDGCDTEEDSDQQDVNMMHSKKAIPLSSIGKFSDLKIEEQEQDEQEDTTPRRTYLPSMHVDKDNQLDVNPSVYNLFRELTIEWPCLSFDFLSTDVNENGNLSVSIVAGSQAASSSKNRLYYIKASNLKVLKKKHSIDSGYLSSSSDNSSSDEDEHQVNVKCKASSPALSSISVPHQGCVNRVRVSRATGIPAYVASWSDLGKIYIWNSEDHLRQLDDPVNSLKYSFIGEDLKKRHKAVKNNSTASLAVMTDHGTDEGYALAWSIKGTPGRILSGDCSGKIVMSQLGEATFTPLGKLLNPSCSVEDLSWSTIEAEIFASADTSGMVKIWDTRQALSPVATIHASACDVNVISWNPSSTFLLASGADDGEWATWDLRKVFTASPSKSDPLVSFRWHQAPISSIEWHPCEPSVITVSGSDDQLTIWDLAVECESSMDSQPEDGVPAQLMFIHQGQRDMKEAHWAPAQTRHAAANGVIVSTSATGFHIFKPFNI
ncbi:Glutamate-rich WD repeat-containing protein 1 [Mitosporidium daphniae]